MHFDLPSDGSTLNQSPNISKSPLGQPGADKRLYCFGRDCIVLERAMGLNTHAQRVAMPTHLFGALRWNY